MIKPEFKRQTLVLVSCTVNSKHYAWIEKHKLGYIVKFKHDPELPIFASNMKYAKQVCLEEIEANK